MAPTAQQHQGSVAIEPRGDKPISIRSYRDEDHKAVVDLFASGMLYYADANPDARQVWDAHIAHSIADDLAHIQETYFARGGHFWVATADENGKEVIVGIVAIEAKPGNEGELRRMSVKSEYRRYGVGRLLVSHLEQWAVAHGLVKVWLSTGGPQVDAKRFYQSVGYHHFKTDVYCEDPYFELAYYEKVLA